jgi:hypothetical protein
MNVGKPPKYNSPEELEIAINKYLNDVIAGTRTITGLALYLGFESRQSFYDYEKREGYSYIIKRARLFVESSYEEKLSGNSPTGAIFALKNMGWKDKTETGFTDAEGKDVQQQFIFQAAPNCKPIEDSNTITQ